MRRKHSSLAAAAGWLMLLAGLVLMAEGFLSGRAMHVLFGVAAMAIGGTAYLSGTKVPALLRREFMAYFYSPLAYVIAAAFMLAVGVLFLYELTQFEQLSQQGTWRPGGVMGSMVESLVFLMVFFCPLISMGALSEEKRSGTIEVLMTAPVTSFEVVLAKFLGCLLFYLYLLALTLVYVVVMMVVGRPDYGPIVSMYVCLMLLGGMFLSVGVLVSACTRNQIVAAVVTFVLLFMLYLVDSFGEPAGGRVREICNYLSVAKLWGTYFKGVIDSRHAVYSLSFTAATLFVAVRIVESRTWR